jgi:G3E family GTPase
VVNKKVNDYVHEHQEDQHGDHHHHEHNSDHLENDGFVLCRCLLKAMSTTGYAYALLMSISLKILSMNTYHKMSLGLKIFCGSVIIFQLTGLRYNLNADQWHSPEKNQLVFIGKNLAVNQIHSQLQKCLV